MFQETIIVGVMGRDPVAKNVNGRTAAQFSVATTRYLGEGRQPETVWFNVTCWEKTADHILKMAQKGTKVFCKGRLICDPVTGGPRVWQRNDGSYGSSFEIVASNIKMIANYKTQDAQYQQQPQQQAQHAKPQQAQPVEQQPQQQTDFGYDDDIPF